MRMLPTWPVWPRETSRWPATVWRSHRRSQTAAPPRSSSARQGSPWRTMAWWQVRSDHQRTWERPTTDDDDDTVPLPEEDLVKQNLFCNSFLAEDDRIWVWSAWWQAFSPRWALHRFPSQSLDIHTVTIGDLGGAFSSSLQRLIPTIHTIQTIQILFVQRTRSSPLLSKQVGWLGSPIMLRATGFLIHRPINNLAPTFPQYFSCHTT